MTRMKPIKSVSIAEKMIQIIPPIGLNLSSVGLLCVLRYEKNKTNGITNNKHADLPMVNPWIPSAILFATSSSETSNAVATNAPT